MRPGVLTCQIVQHNCGIVQQLNTGSVTLDPGAKSISVSTRLRLCDAGFLFSKRALIRHLPMSYTEMPFAACDPWLLQGNRIKKGKEGQ